MRKALMAFNLVILTALAVPASAYMISNSNLGANGYPPPSCHEPVRPYEFRLQSEVNQYEFQANEYIKCVERYVKNANDDIKTIQELAQKAIKKANAL